MRNNKRIIELRNGKRVERAIRTNKDGWRYIVYNGHRIGVKFGYGCCWYEE